MSPSQRAFLSLVRDHRMVFCVPDTQGFVGRSEIAVRGIVIDIVFVLLSQELRVPVLKVLPEEIRESTLTLSSISSIVVLHFYLSLLRFNIVR